MKNILLCIFYLLLLSCGPEQTESTVSEEIANTSELKDFVTNDRCSFETYIVYADSFPLYKSPNTEPVGYFRFEDDPEYDFGGGFTFKDSELGWLQIGKDKYYPHLEDYWIQSPYIEVGTTNYAGDTIPLYASANIQSGVAGYLNEESKLNVLKCSDDWAYVKKGDTEGWLHPQFICSNPVTNCN